MQGRKIVAGAVCIALACGSVPKAAFAGETADAPTKTEVVYAKTDEAGSVEGIYVVNTFTGNKAGQVSDPGSYESVTNLSTTENLTAEGGTVRFTTTGNDSFSYQGNLAATTQLPWDVSVRYTLDGAEVAAEELAGASGALAIQVTIKPHEGSTAANASFADNYLVQAQASFDADTFEITRADGATISYAGSGASASGMAIPGESQTITIEGVAKDFSYDGWQIAALPLNMAVEVAEEDTSELSDRTGELNSAVSSANSGAAQLASGSVSLASGIKTLSGGLAALSTQNASLTGGWESISAGIGSASAGAQQLASGSQAFAGSVEGALAQAAQGAAALEQAQAAYQSAATAAQQEIAADGTVSAQTFASLNDAAQALAQASGSAGAYQALSQVNEGYASIDGGIGSLAGGLSQLEAGTGAFTSGLSDYTAGVTQAASGSQSTASGAATLASGSSSLASGLSQLGSETSGLDKKIIDELQEKIDEKLGANFEAHSFVEPSNTDVKAVQFVYVVGGVHAPEAAEDAEGGEAQTTLGQRIAAVFENLFSWWG